jgi:Tfp pilus assembly protein PilX
MRKTRPNLKQGQALVVLIVFVAIATIIISSAVVVTIVNSRLAADQTLSANAFSAAEAGANEAVLSILRNPNYTGGTLTTGSAVATITVSGSSSKTIVSVGSASNFVKKVQVTGTYAGNNFTISGWNQIN